MHDGRLEYLSESTYWKSELIAIKREIELVIEEGDSKMVIESDAELIIKFLNKDEPPPWRLLNCLKCIWTYFETSSMCVLPCV